MLTGDTVLGVADALASEANVMAKNGVESIRFPIYWSSAQPYKKTEDIPMADRADYHVIDGVPTDLHEIDDVVGAAATHGYKLLPTVLAAPPWASDDKPGPFMLRPRHVSDYTRFLAR